MIAKTALLVASLVAADAVGAATSYTPAQLRALIAAGTPPAQSSPTSQSQVMSFSACVSKVKDIVDAVGSNYPTDTVVDTVILHITKVWTNDAAMVLTCSKPDGKLVITTSKYR